jgi:membrane-bound lytic murein transglycosylase
MKNTYYIYKLVCDNAIDFLYINFTKNPAQKKRYYKDNSYLIYKVHKNELLYQTIRENGGWDNWRFIVINQVNCTKYEIHSICESYRKQELNYKNNNLENSEQSFRLIRDYSSNITADISNIDIKEIQENTRKYKKIQENTEKYKKIQENSEEKIQENTEKYKKIQENTEKYKKIQENTEKYKKIQENSEEKIQENTEKYKKIQENSEEKIQENTQGNIDNSMNNPKQLCPEANVELSKYHQDLINDIVELKNLNTKKCNISLKTNTENKKLRTFKCKNRVYHE